MFNQTTKQRHNNSSNFSRKPPPTNQLKRDLSDYVDILNFLLVELGMPAKARSFVDALIGASEARTGWFDLNDYELGERLPSRGQTHRADSIQKRAQRYRKPLKIWQDESSIVMIEIQLGGKKQSEEYPTRYKTDMLLDTWADAVQLARGSADWETNLKKAKKDAARTVATKLVGANATTSRGNLRRTDTASLMVSNMKSSASYARKSMEYAVLTGHDPEIVQKELKRKIDIAYYRVTSFNESRQNNQEPTTE